LANPAALAYHFGAAHEWRKTIQYAIAAGDAARDRYASHTALRHYEQAQAAFRNLSDAHPDTAIELRERLGQAHLVLNQQGQAEIAFRRMLDAARATGSRLAEGQALVWLSLVCMRLNRTRDAHAFGDTALAVAERAGDSRLRALTHWNIGHLHEVVGNLDVAFHHTELAERLARDEGHRDVQGWCLANLAIMAVWRGDYARAESMAAEALDLARADHDAYSICGCAFRRALALGELGRYELARQTVQAGLDSAEESGERRNRMKLLNTMGWIHSELGDVETARHWDERALAASREGRDERVTEAERYSLLNLATDALQIGDLDAAETRLLEFERSLDDWEYSRFRYENRHQLLRAELALARAEHDDALRWTVAAGALAEAKGMPKNVAKCRMLEGRVSLALGDANQAVDVLRQAMSLADRLRHGSLGWQTRYWLGRACASTGSPAEAARLYQEALARVSSLADSLADERLRDCFLSSALVKQVRSAAAAGRASPAKPAYPAGLTEREVDVLRLIADGRPDREIAETLFISPRTVNTHVANILNKLGVSSRSAATAYAVRHGLI
jgi:ATP/maltotriose-dependent transcriptional regulator MalT